MTSSAATVVAAALDAAHREGRLLESGAFPELADPAVADLVAAELVRLRDPDGSRVHGWKIGYSSAAMREQMRVDAPNSGRMYRDRIVDSGPLRLRLTHPRVEPEIAVSLAREVAWGELAPLDASGRVALLAEAVASVRCALEVVDAVWRDYRFRLEENTADGSSFAAAVLGDEVPRDVPLDGIDVALLRDGRPEQHGHSREALGHPLLAVAWLLEHLGDRGTTLAPGEFVLTGGLTRAIEAPTDIRIEGVFRVGAWSGGADVVLHGT